MNQAVVRALAEEEDEAKPLRFIGSCTMKDGRDAMLALIKKALRIDVVEYRSQKNAEEAFAHLRSQTESARVSPRRSKFSGSRAGVLGPNHPRGLAWRMKACLAAIAPGPPRKAKGCRE